MMRVRMKSSCDTSGEHSNDVTTKKFPATGKKTCVPRRLLRRSMAARRSRSTNSVPKGNFHLSYVTTARSAPSPGSTWARPSATALWEGGGRSRREQIVRCREPAKLVTAERLQRAAVGAREIVADDDRLVQRFGYRLDPADEIDGRADHGEIEPVGGADIAVDGRADVKGDDDLERRLVHQRRIVYEPTRGLDRLHRRVERAARGSGGLVGMLDRKNCQQSVADEF